MGPRVVAAAAVAVAAGAAYIYRLKQQENDVLDDDESADEELPPVTSEEVVAIFRRLCEIMNATVTQVMRKINASAQQAIPQAMLAQYLVEHFEAQLKEAQDHVFGEFGVDAEDVEAAVAYYEREKDAPVVEAVNALRQLYLNVGGSIDMDLPESLTVEAMCDIFEEYMAAVQQAQLAYTAHLHSIKAKGLQTTAQHLNETRQAKIASHVAVVLQKHGLTNLVFQVAIEKYNDHPLFQQKIAQFKAPDKPGKR